MEDTRNPKLPSLLAYVRAHRESFVERVKPPKLGGYYAAQNAALVGDRQLDLHLYTELGVLSEDGDVKGRATLLRSSLVKNRNLAKVAGEVGAELFGFEQWELLSEKDRGTVLEAVPGVAFDQEDRQLTATMKKLLTETLSALRTAARSAGEFGKS